MSFYVYILLCEDGSFYTGYTKSLDLRVSQHMSGGGGRYTKLRRPTKLVYADEFGTKKEAMKRERSIKKLSHEKKGELINRNLVTVNRKKECS